MSKSDSTTHRKRLQPMANVSKNIEQTSTRKLKTLLHRLIDMSSNPSQLIELYYWSAEPGLAQFMRHFIALPDEPRKVLRAFLAATSRSTETISVTITSKGRVILTSPLVSDLAIIKTAGEGSDDTPGSMH